MKSLALMLLLVMGCATAAPTPPASLPATDLDSLVPPPAPLPPLPSDLPDGPTRPIEEGDCPGFAPGMWVSERSYNVLVDKASELEQRRVESSALRTLRVTERSEQQVREAAFRSALDGAEKSARWRLWIGIAIGAGTVLTGAWAAGQVAR